MTDIVERLERLDTCTNDPISLKHRLRNPDGPEAAAEIRRLWEQCDTFAKAVIELSDNVEDRDGLSDTTEYTVDAARAYSTSEKG